MHDFWKGKRVLLTGHTGFKGSWLAFWLKLLGAEVCGYALTPETSPNLFEILDLESGIESVIADIRDLEKLVKIAERTQPEIVLHLAAQPLVRRSYREPVETYGTNVIGTVNLLESVRRNSSIRSVVIVTTDKVYENSGLQRSCSESDRLGGFDPYSNSKACAELVVSAYRRSFFSEGDTLVATARAGNVIGGGDWSEDRLLPDVFRSIFFGEKLLIRNPLSIRPWQHVLEPLSGYLKLAEELYKGKSGFADAWNFGPNEQDSRPVEWILSEIGKVWPNFRGWKIDRSTQPHEAHILKLDSSKAKEELLWLPKLNLAEAIGLTAEWYKDFQDHRDLISTTRQQIEFYMGKQPLNLK